MFYLNRVEELLSSGIYMVDNARHVLGFMVDNNGTLDHLSPSAFKAELGKAARQVRTDAWNPRNPNHKPMAERLAKSHGI